MLCPHTVLKIKVRIARVIIDNVLIEFADLNNHTNLDHKNPKENRNFHRFIVE